MTFKFARIKCQTLGYLIRLIQKLSLLAYKQLIVNNFFCLQIKSKLYKHTICKNLSHFSSTIYRQMSPLLTKKKKILLFIFLCWQTEGVQNLIDWFVNCLCLTSYCNISKVRKFLFHGCRLVFLRQVRFLNQLRNPTNNVILICSLWW